MTAIPARLAMDQQGHPRAEDAPPGRYAYRAAVQRAAARGDSQEVLALTRAHAWGIVRRDLARLGAAALRGAVAAGPWLPLAAMLVGLAFQDLAALAFQLLTPILVTTLVAGLLGMPALSSGAALGVGALGVTLSLGLVAPWLGWGAAALAGAGAEERAWVALASAAPVGSAALAAALALRLPGAVAVGAVVASLLATPLVLPLAALLVGSAAEIHPGELAQRLALIAGLPALIALGLRRVPALRRPVARRRAAEVALVALALLGLARMHGVRETVAADPWLAVELLGLALLPTLAGVLAVLPLLRRGAGAEGLLAGGFRNVALVWAATSHALPPEGALFMALTALPVYATPALVGLLLRRPAGARP